MVLENLKLTFNNDNKFLPINKLTPSNNDIDIFGTLNPVNLEDDGIFSQNNVQSTNSDEFSKTNSEETSVFNSVTVEKAYGKQKIIKNLPTLLKESDGSVESKNEIITYIKSIDSKNFSEVLRNSESILGVNSLVKRIFDTNGLNTAEKKDALKYLYEQGVKHAENKGVPTDDFLDKLNENIENYDKNSKKSIEAAIISDFRKLVDRTKLEKKSPDTNGKIDRMTHQGKAGDCWLLATINGYLTSEEGKKYINECVSKDEATGNIKVVLKGANKEYEITQKEINNNTNYSSGDGDVRAVEIAVQKYFEEKQDIKNTDIYGKASYMGLLILNGNKNISMAKTPSDIKNVINRMSDDKNFNPVAVTAILGSKDIDGLVGNIGSANGQTKVSICKQHAYTLAGVEGDKVIIVDPNNSGEKIYLDKGLYLYYFNDISYVDLSATKEK